MSARRGRRVAAGLVAAAAGVLAGVGGCASPAPTPKDHDEKGRQAQVSPQGARVTNVAPKDPEIR
jgi:hypothetical protein